MEKIIKIFLVILMFGCLLDMLYVYFQVVRFLSLISFGLLACQANQQNKQINMIVYGILALLFQPFFKIALSRILWNIIDVIVGIGLLISLFKKRENE